MSDGNFVFMRTKAKAGSSHERYIVDIKGLSLALLVDDQIVFKSDDDVLCQKVVTALDQYIKNENDGTKAAAIKKIKKELNL